MMNIRFSRRIAGMAAVFILLCAPAVLSAHCDTMNGPVVKDARKALEKRDVTPVLKWIRPERENEIKDAFIRTLAVRVKGPEAEALADRYFFETLVRVHRAGEGAPYTGLKDDPVEPVVALSDKALEAGSADQLIQKLTQHLAEGVHERFMDALEKKKRADESVEAGREYVEAYVRYMHYVEGIHAAIQSAGGHQSGEAGTTEPAHHGE
jgi:hypothetical protein